jgi:Heterokaryon incompatibility protein (HET)
MSRLPQTILDAIMVCQKLAERYLWVDAICIIQDDEEDKAAQITEMEKIYSLAKVTLIAVCGKNPSQGLSCLRFRDPSQATCVIDGISYVTCETSVRQSLRQTPWHSRG